MSKSVSEQQVDAHYAKLKNEAEEMGYHLNPDVDFTKELVIGLLENTARYGYQSCPCRLAAGIRAKDLDIICPCNYRDPDLDDYNTCYCGLYVTRKVVEGETKIGSIPERRPPQEVRESMTIQSKDKVFETFTIPVWRCTVCGYLCAREQPPEICPICKVDRDRFEKIT